MESLLAQIKTLSVEEMETFVSKVIKLITENLNSSNYAQTIISKEHNGIHICPKCGSVHIYRNGHTKNGAQKYICADCRKAFSDSTNSIAFHSRISYEQLREIIKYEFIGATLKVIAKEVHLSITTVFSWRHKIYKAMEIALSQLKLTEEVELDAKYLSINLKGTKPKNMPRYSKKRTSSSYSGISHHKICIITGVSSNDTSRFIIGGLGHESTKMYKQIMGECFKDVRLVISDSFRGIIKACKKFKITNSKIKPGEYLDKNGNSLAATNNLHKEIELLIARTHGISTRHLIGYLSMLFFKRHICFKYEYNEAKQELLRTSLINKVTGCRNKDIYKFDLPIDLRKAYGEYHYGIYAEE